MTGDFLGSLERLVVLLFEHFPRLGPASRFSAYKAVNILLATLAQRGALLKTLVSNIGIINFIVRGVIVCTLLSPCVNAVYQGLIRTCSHPVSLQVSVYVSNVTDNGSTYCSQSHVCRLLCLLYNCVMLSLLQGVVTRPVESIAEGITSYNDYVELWFHIMKPQRKEVVSYECIIHVDFM